MKSLIQHELDKAEYYRESTVPRPNGIECPVCQNELVDTSPLVRVMTNPPKTIVHCPACGWTGARTV